MAKLNQQPNAGTTSPDALSPKAIEGKPVATPPTQAASPADIKNVISKPISIPDGITQADARRMVEGMILIRAYDERQQKLQRSGRIGFCVVSTGEEAAQVGTAHPMQAEDWVYPYYRQHGILLYRGVPLDRLANQLFGNSNDQGRGRQMPVHYSHRGTRFVSFSSVIGTHLIHAAGTAMAAKYQANRTNAKTPDKKVQFPAVVTYIGDGGTSANDFHSAMTFAGVYKPPMVLFIINNQYAISLPVDQQCGASTLADKGAGYGIPSVRIDGNDVFAVAKASEEAYAKARNGEGPTLIELLTYRAGPHSSSDDPSRYRGNEAETWLSPELDPIARAVAALKDKGWWTDEDEAHAWQTARDSVNNATTEAAGLPEPTWESLFDDVYAQVPQALARQRDELIARETGFERQHEGEFPI